MPQIASAICASAASGSRNAKVATFGERVEDIFCITDPHDRPSKTR